MPRKRAATLRDTTEEKYDPSKKFAVQKGELIVDWVSRPFFLRMVEARQQELAAARIPGAEHKRKPKERP